MRKLIVITEFMDEPSVEVLRKDFEVHYDPKLVDKREALIGMLADCQGLIVRNKTQVNAELLAKAPHLKTVGRLGVGLDNIDVGLCNEKNIAVIPATGANARSVAEYAVCTAVMLLRESYLSTQELMQGKWPRNALSNGKEALGKTFGLIGYGYIGQLTGSLAAAFGMKLIAYDPALNSSDKVWSATHCKPMSLSEVVSSADVISLHIPLLESTRNLVNEHTLSSMKKGAVLINTSRGGIVDEKALANSLRSGHLGGAALDVFDSEPLPPNSVLADCPRLLLTPHIAGVSYESNVRVSEMIAQEVARSLSK